MWTRPVATSCTGWLAPRWPNLSLKVPAPNARPSTWWPRQMPRIGALPIELLDRRRPGSRGRRGRRGRARRGCRRASARGCRLLRRLRAASSRGSRGRESRRRMLYFTPLSTTTTWRCRRRAGLVPLVRLVGADLTDEVGVVVAGEASGGGRALRPRSRRS